MCLEGQWTRHTSADLPHPLHLTLRPVAAVEVAQGALFLSTRRSEMCITAHLVGSETHTSSRSASDIVGSALVDSKPQISVHRMLRDFAEVSPHIFQKAKVL